MVGGVPRSGLDGGYPDQVWMVGGGCVPQPGLDGGGVPQPGLDGGGIPQPGLDGGRGYRSQVWMVGVTQDTLHHDWMRYPPGQVWMVGGYPPP